MLHAPGSIALSRAIRIDDFRRGKSLSRLASESSELIQPYRDLLTAPPDLMRSSVDTTFDVVPDDLARIVLERFHYLQILTDSTVCISACGLPKTRQLNSSSGLSAFDLDHIATELPSPMGATRVMVASRVYAFDWAPSNTLSHLLSKRKQVGSSVISKPSRARHLRQSKSWVHRCVLSCCRIGSCWDERQVLSTNILIHTT